MTKKSSKTKLTESLKTKIRTEFVQGVELQSGEIRVFTIEKLIRKHNVASATLYRAAKKENWKMLREQYNADLQERINAERQKQVALKSVKFDDRLLEEANKLVEQVAFYLQLNETVMKEGRKPFPPSQFLAITNAALAAQKLGKIAMGEITENINVNATIKEADAFKSILGLLDTVAEQRKEGDSKFIH